MSLEDISPDRRLLLVRPDSFARRALFTYSLADERLRRVTAADGAASWDRSGGALTLVANKSLLSFQLLHASEDKLLDLPARADYLRWSPDGTLLRITVRDSGGEPIGTWEFDRRRSVARERDDISTADGWPRHGVWSADGQDFLFDAGGEYRQDLWVSKEKGSRRRAEPTRLTDGPASWTWPAFTEDKSQIVALHDERRSELSYFDAAQQEWRSAWRGLPAYELDYSRDGRRVAFIYQPDHTLWTARPDGSGGVQLTSPILVAHQPHWSPDGRSIAFMGQNRNGHRQVFVIPAEGGKPKELLPSADNQGVPTWSPNGKQIIFGEPLARKQPSAMCLHIIDLPTRTAREIPGTHGLWSPRWSPDGKYILAVATDNKSIRIAFPDWTHSFEVVRMFNVDNVMWSYDSKYIYFDGRLQPDDTEDLYRIGIATKTLEKLALMRNFVPALENWYGVSPDGTLLASRGYVTQEIYALKCQLP
jgi:Tol biopolymer transport system component